MKNTGMTKKAPIYIILTIIWIAIIFSFSLQPGDTSSQISSGFGKWLLDVFVPGLVGKLESMPTELLERMHFLLRKCAHFSEYFVLGILMRQSILQTGIRHKLIVAFVGCVMVASIDETIQRFVSGRSGQIADVILDSVGALCGICFVVLMGKMIRRMKQSRTESCV